MAVYRWPYCRKMGTPRSWGRVYIDARRMMQLVEMPVKRVQWLPFAPVAPSWRIDGSLDRNVN